MVRHLHIDLASAHSVASVGRTTKLYRCSDASLIKCEIYRGKDTANKNEMRKQEQNAIRHCHRDAHEVAVRGQGLTKCGRCACIYIYTYIYKQDAHKPHTRYICALYSPRRLGSLGARLTTAHA